VRALETHSVEILRDGLVTEARLIHDAALPLLASGAGRGPVQALAERFGAISQARVTVIAPDGTVLGDSRRTAADLPAMENHANRPEVRAARGGAGGSDVRRSRTLDLDMLYVSAPLRER